MNTAFNFFYHYGILFAGVYQKGNKKALIKYESMRYAQGSILIVIKIDTKI